MTRLDRAEHALVVALCSYEVAAIFSGGRLPTLTRLDLDHPIIGDSIVRALRWHFARSRHRGATTTT